MGVLGESMNRSSSFYSEAYYEKARKQAFKKKPIYRQRNKELYDQEHQLDILRYYFNRSGRCQMIRYYEMIAQLFFALREKNIKGSDEYNQTVKQYVAKVNQKIKYFHEILQCDQYETREQRQYRIKEEENEAKGVNPQKKENTQPKDQPLIRPPPQSSQENAKKLPKRLDTCNQCPIFIEQYQVNFERTSTQISRQSSFWDKLNGNQKLAKFRKHVEQNLKILKFELENKCEFARHQNGKPNRFKRFGRP